MLQIFACQQSSKIAGWRNGTEVFLAPAQIADDSRLVGVFRDALARIEAVARRKLLARSTRPVDLTGAELSVG